MKYFHPKSLSWWAGVGSIVVGLAQLFGASHPLLNPLAQLVNALSGGVEVSPVAMITTGLGIIGLRDKMERM